MNNNLDFAKVEALRKHMLLTIGHMARLFGVSRMTYHGWMKGTKIRPTNLERVKKTLRELLDIMATHKWPTPDVIASSPKQRIDRLIELLNQDK